MTIIDNMGAKLHICCGIKEEKPNYFAHDFAQSQKIRADLQALPYKNVIIYHFLAEYFVYPIEKTYFCTRY